MSDFHLTLNGHVTPADKARSDYYYLPFALPQPARRLHVRYTYSAAMSSDRVEGGNVIDIGLFDPRGTGFPGAAGFRGWSGSARSHFTLAADEATPGYLPGPLPAGRYHILLGLYRIWPSGADYTVEIDAELGDTPDQAILPTATPSPHPQAEDTGRPNRWLRGDLQSHTVHSDARGTLEQLVAKARAIGLDFLAVTDHNTVSHHPFLPGLAGHDLLLIPGQEATSYYGHMNIWGTGRWCDFRCRDDTDMAAVIDLAHASGGLCSINHPKAGGPAWEYSPDLPVDAMEVWQGPWPHRNQESLALWERLLLSGRRLPAVGGSDYHCPAAEETGFLRLGQPTTWLQVHEATVPAILHAIQAGRACISARPDGPRLDIQATAGPATGAMGEVLPVSPHIPFQVTVQVCAGRGYDLHLVADGQLVHQEPVTADPAIVTVSVTAGRYVRAELVGDMPAGQLPPNAPAGLDLHGWRWALSNPIYVQSVLGGGANQ